MYINNITGKPIKDISFEGFMFTIPAGVSVCYEPFGKFVLNLYKVEGERGGAAPVVEAKPSQWKGDRYVAVRRFDLNFELIPKRADLIKIAKSRGIDAETIEQWKEDEEIDNSEIAKTINELDVPDHIAFPVVGDTTEVPTDEEKAAEDALNGPQTGAGEPEDDAPGADAEQTTPAAPAAKPTGPAAPTTKAAEKRGAAKKVAKAVAKAPKTRKPSKK